MSSCSVLFVEPTAIRKMRDGDLGPEITKPRRVLPGQEGGTHESRMLHHSRMHTAQDVQDVGHIAEALVAAEGIVVALDVMGKRGKMGKHHGVPFCP